MISSWNRVDPNSMTGVLIGKENRHRVRKREEIDTTHRHTEKIRQIMPSDIGDKDCNDAATRPKKGN